MSAFSRFRDKIELNYTLEAEKFTGAVISRVAFKVPGKDDTEKTDVIERTMRLNEQSKPDFKCREHIVYILVIASFQLISAAANFDEILHMLDTFV